MKRLVRVSFSFSTAEGFDRAKEILLAINQGNLAVPRAHGGYDFTFEADDPTLAVLLPLVERARRELPRGFGSLVREDRVYAEAELRGAELLQLMTPAQAGSGGDRYGTQWDTSKTCPGCGTVTEQISELVIDKAEMGRKDIAHTYEFEYIVSAKVAQLLRRHNLTGLELRPVRHKTGRMRNEPELWQISPLHALPPVAPPTRLEQVPSFCPQCGRQGLFVRSEIYYYRRDLNASGVEDFNRTHEYFGSGNFTKPFIIISSQAYRVFRENRIRPIDVEPVQIIE